MGIVLDPWQRFVLDGALGEKADGSWAASQVGLVVPRQNGKNVVLVAVELAGLFLFDEQLIVHSAHKFSTAAEHFLAMQRVIESSDDLSSQVLKIITANGKEAIHLRNGARLVFVARSRGAARGISCDRLVLDEAYDLRFDALGAMLPALSARPNPQVWFTSSAPHADSEVLHDVRRRGIGANPGDLCYFEWGNPPGTSRDDEVAWARANPGLERIGVDWIRGTELAMLRARGEEFDRERLGIPSEEDGTAGVFGPGVWVSRTDLGSVVDGVPVFALDVAPGMRWASFALAGARASGGWHVEVGRREQGTDWVVSYAQKLGRPLWVDPRSPVAGLLDDLRAAGVQVEELPAGVFPAACAGLQVAVADGRVSHRGQQSLDDAVECAAVKPVGDQWVWARARTDADISPLVAVTVALWAASQPAKLSFVY